MVTYGFYDSVNHDRRYNAIQMSSIFDGIINDGIFMSIGDRFNITASGNDMMVTVGTGRAWFDHTWTLNDSLFLLELPPAELILNRYDAIVLEVNSDVSVRANTIKVVSGTPSSNPAYPTMINTELIHQYPLAYVYVGKNVTTIRQADITSMVGKAPAPYVTGIIETIDIETMVAQWEDQWKKFFEMQTNDMTDTNANWKEQWEAWYREYTSEMDEASKRWKDLWHEWYHMYTDSSSEEFGNWKEQQKADFIDWFNSLKDMLSDQVEAMMAAEIEELKKRMEMLEKFESDLATDQTIYYTIDDSNGDPITDDTGDPLIGQVKFVTGSDDMSDAVINFDSKDELNPEEYQCMPLVKSPSTLKTLVSTFSIAVKNIRYLFKKIFNVQKNLRAYINDTNERFSVVENDLKHMLKYDASSILSVFFKTKDTIYITNGQNYDMLYIVIQGDAYNGLGKLVVQNISSPLCGTSQAAASTHSFSVSARYYGGSNPHIEFNRVVFTGWESLQIIVYGINFGNKEV